jgi:hypothetical protein
MIAYIALNNMKQDWLLAYHLFLPCSERSRFLSAALRRECCGGKTYAHFAYALSLDNIVLMLITPG